MRFFALLLILLVVCASVQCNRPNQQVSDVGDFEKIQGRWELISGERNGEPFGPEVTKIVTLTFVGHALTTQKGDDVTEATFELHPRANPKGMDLNMDGNVGNGIYQLEGNTLKILHGEVGEARPANFDAVKGGNLTMLILRKAN